MTLKIASIKLYNKKVEKDLEFTKKNLKFNCKRCARLCCRLGGPPLFKKDVNKLQKLGYQLEEFLQKEHSSRQYNSRVIGNLKNKKDGSCIFLKSTKGKRIKSCTIYDSRPILCRLFPFKIAKTDKRIFSFEVIPCCNGLNDYENGDNIDEIYFKKNIHSLLLEYVELLE